jgi:predicted nucleic acid-binding Zn ribbon protein
MTRRSPRPLAAALAELTDALAPATPLAAVQQTWARAVGAQIASQATPIALRDGVLTVSCAAAVWAHELELMGPELAARLNAEMGSETVLRLRCRATSS